MINKDFMGEVRFNQVLKDEKELHIRVLIPLTKKLCSGGIIMWP